jgi:hypothetical protein
MTENIGSDPDGPALGPERPPAIDKAAPHPSSTERASARPPTDADRTMPDRLTEEHAPEKGPTVAVGEPLWRYERLSSRFRKPPPHDQPNVTTVFRTKHGSLRTYETPPTGGEWFREAVVAAYHVDTGDHTDSIELDLPSKVEGGGFRARIALTWNVSEPVATVQAGLVDPGSIYRPELERILVGITREHDVGERRAAEDEIFDQVLGKPIALPHGLKVTITTIRLLSDDSRANITDANAKHELALLKLQHYQEIKALKEQFELKQESKRTKSYLKALRKGQDYLIALKLASNREDVDKVIQLLMKQRQLDFDSARGTLQAILDANLANRKDVADIMARATNVLAEHLTRAPFGASDSKRAVAGKAIKSSQPADIRAIDDGQVVDAEIVPPDDDEDEDDDY